MLGKGIDDCIKLVLGSIHSEFTSNLLKTFILSFYDIEYYIDINKSPPNKRWQAIISIKLLVKNNKLAQVLVKLPINKRLIDNIILICPFLMDVIYYT